MKSRLLVPVLAAMAGLGLLSLAWLMTQRPSAPPPSTVGGPFTLTAQDGRTFTQRDVLGAPYVVFFGFTHCPDVCPTTLFEMSEALRATGERGAKLKALFISVDGERDTPAILKDYLSNFDPRIVGLTGDEKAVDTAVRAYKAYFKRVSLKDGGYTIDHTAGVYLMDGKGRFVRLLNMKRRSEEIAKDLLAQL
jgi:protein SCO1